MAAAAANEKEKRIFRTDEEDAIDRDRPKVVSRTFYVMVTLLSNCVMD